MTAGSAPAMRAAWRTADLGATPVVAAMLDVTPDTRSSAPVRGSPTAPRMPLRTPVTRLLGLLLCPSSSTKASSVADSPPYSPLKTPNSPLQCSDVLTLLNDARARCLEVKSVLPRLIIAYISCWRASSERCSTCEAAVEKPEMDVSVQPLMCHSSDAGPLPRLARNCMHKTQLSWDDSVSSQPL